MNHLSHETLSAFTDGELTATEALAAQQHIATCHECALAALSLAQMKSATARVAQHTMPLPDALARLTAHLHTPVAEAPAKSSNVLPFRKTPMRLIAWSSLAAALLLTASLALLQQRHSTAELSAELLDQHLATLATSAAPQVISTDRHTVKPWFAGKLPFTFNLPEPTAYPADTTLLGADLTYVHGQPAALLLFHIGKHQASIFITQQATTLPTRSDRSGFTIDTVGARDLHFLAISDVNPAELHTLLATLAGVQ